MARVHYFQRYSQKENVVTNNTLLLFARLYAYSPFRFQDFLTMVLDIPLEVGVSFQQQLKLRKHSVPDGILSQRSFKIVIETKLYQNYSSDQLRRHLSSFDNEETKVLLLISPSEPEQEFQDKVISVVREFNQNTNANILFSLSTFATVIKHFEAILTTHDYEIEELIDDYKDFCSETGLLPSKHLLRAVPCGATLAENFEFNLYYDLAERRYRHHHLIGIYSKKSIRGVGKLENIVRADLLGSSLDVLKSTLPVQPTQQERISRAIAKAHTKNGWDISKGHTFFLVEKFYETFYRKTSWGPLRGVQYFDLDNILDESLVEDIAAIAEKLKEMVW